LNVRGNFISFIKFFIPLTTIPLTSLHVLVRIRLCVSAVNFLMAAEDEAVVYAFGLGIVERRQRGEGGGFGFVENRFGEGLQFVPAGPRERGGVRDLAEKAAPLDDDAINIAAAEEVGDPEVFVQRIFVDGRDDLFRARAVFRRHTVFQISGNGLLAENPMRRDGEASAPAVFLAAKTKAGVEVGEVVNHFIERITGVFESGGNGEAIALRKKADDLAAQRGNTGGIYEAEATPEERGAGVGGEFAADGHERTLRAIGGENVALLRMRKRDAVAIHRHTHREISHADVREDVMFLGDPAHDGSFVLREFSFEEWRNFFRPNRERRLASIPIRQAAHPFGDDDAVARDAVSNNGRAAIDFLAIGFGKNAQNASANFFERGWLGQD
jgi:hypothetical protein